MASQGQAGQGTVHYVNRYYEKDVTNGVVTTYYYHGSRLVALRKGTTLEYVHQDHLGGTIATTNTSGAIAATQEYYAFGETRSSTGTLSTDKKFTGQRLDSNTGLYFYNARYYDANIGRFVSADTIVPDPSNPQDFNRHSYVRNNPTKYTDPSGYCIFLIGVDTVACVGIGVGLLAVGVLTFPGDYDDDGDIEIFGEAVAQGVKSGGEIIIDSVGDLVKGLFQSSIPDIEYNGHVVGGHAMEQAEKRGVSLDDAVKAVEKGLARPSGEHPGSTQYLLPREQSSSGRAVEVHVDERGRIVTVIDRGTSTKIPKNFQPQQERGSNDGGAD